jgi:hypothetical protein
MDGWMIIMAMAWMERNGTQKRKPPLNKIKKDDFRYKGIFLKQFKYVNFLDRRK